MASDHVRDYDHFKDLLGITFNPTTVKKIVLDLQYSYGDIEKLVNAEHPGSSLVETMEETDTISPSDISKLTTTLHRLHLDTIDSKVQAWFNQIKVQHFKYVRAKLRWIGNIKPSHRSPELYPSKQDFQEFANGLEDSLNDEITLELISKLELQRIHTQTVLASTERRKLIQTLIAEKIISNKDISPLLKILHDINRSHTAKQIQVLFEGFEREDREPDSSGKSLGKVIYRFTTAKEKQQEHRTLQDHRRTLDESSKIRMCHIGQRSLSEKTVKVILLFGRSGAGKTTMINALVNNILEVKWENAFRYKIPVDEEEKKVRSQAYGQTKWISGYFLHGHNIIIVDTPGFQDDQGKDRDKFITDQVRMFFDKQYSQINYINLVAFVMNANDNRLSETQRTLFELILKLFGKNVKNCICLFATFSEQVHSKSPVEVAADEVDVSFAKAFQFNNLPLFMQKTDLVSALSDADLDDDSENINLMMHLKWKLTERNLNKCLQYLLTLPEVSTDDTAQVLADRRSLDKILQGILQVINSAIIQLAELKKDKESAQENKERIKSSEDFKYTVLVEKVEKNKIFPKKAMVCHNCQRTCDPDCSSYFIVFCSAMRFFALFRGCGVCEHNCAIDKHQRTDYEYKRKREAITKTNVELLVQLQTYDCKLCSIEEAIQQKEKETNDLLKRKVEQARECVTRLEQIALKPGTKTIKEYLDDMIKKERTDGEDGWEERVKLLDELVKREVKFESERWEGTNI